MRIMEGNSMQGLPWWPSGKECACQCRRHGFSPVVGKMPWRRKWQPTPAFLPGKSHGQRNLALFAQGCKVVRDNLATKQHQHAKPWKRRSEGPGHGDKECTSLVRGELEGKCCWSSALG